MLGLPPATAVRRALPKTPLLRQMRWTPAQRARFEGMIETMTFVHCISPRTLPFVAEGAAVREIFVVEVAVKSTRLDVTILSLLAAIPQRIIFMLRCGDVTALAVYHTRLILTPWHPVASERLLLSIDGLDLDQVWESIVAAIGGFTPGSEHSLDQQIRDRDKREKTLRRIETLERQMRDERQPRRQRELYRQIQQLRREITP